MIDATVHIAAASDAARLAGTTDGGYVHVNCPRCGADDAALRYRLNVSSIVTCRICGLSYVDPRVSGPDIERKLQLWAEQDVVDDERLRTAFEPGALEYHARFLAWLSRHARLPGRRLLDIGCSTGAFLKVARDAGWQTQGLEIGIASARYAREILGLEVSRGSIYDFEAPAGSYDAMAMIEVIEHLEQPRLALSQAHRLLKPDGLLLVTTPNFDSLYRRLFGNRWWVINCEDEHIVLYTLDTLAAMLEECGFEVVHRHVRGIDSLGMAREMRDRFLGGAKNPSHPGAAVGGYYESRAAKTRIKNALRKMGILNATRWLLRGLDTTYSWRGSPTFAWGEQLVTIARRPRTQARLAGY